MSSEETLESRQNNEFEALKAIYGEDLKDLRTKRPWNKWCPLDLLISLIPSQSNSGIYKEIFAKLDLHITCSETYPNKVPDITLENPKGLSNNLLKKLKNDLERKANELEGEVMIFQLCQQTQEFLHLHNKPTSKSFYDEMLQRQKEEELKDLEAKQIEFDKQRQITMKEIQLRQNTLKNAEALLRKQQRFNFEHSIDNESDFNRQLSCSTYSAEPSEESYCDHKGTILIEFENRGNRHIQRGECLEHRSNYCTVFSGIDNNSGEIVIISEWKIEIKDNLHLIQVMKQVSSIEQEFNYLVNLKHSNLAHYLDIKSVHFEERVIVYVLNEFIYGSNLGSLFINKNLNFDFQYIKYIAKGVLEALNYLHRHNVVHKDIKDGCVYVNNKGVVILSNYSLYRRLYDLSSNNSSSYSKKIDIYQFGIFILSHIKGFPISESNIAIPYSLPSDLYDFLNKCLLKDEKERYTSMQLLNHPFFQKTIEHFSPKHKIEDKASGDINSYPENPKLPNRTSNQSRIDTEFEFMQDLGKGAYGKVMKVRNKLDNSFYAIKRIKLNPKNHKLNRKIVSEVRLLSQLYHENVVRYSYSWIESRSITNDKDKISQVTISTSEISTNNPKISLIYDSKSQMGLGPPSDNGDSDSDEDNSADGWDECNQDDTSDYLEFEEGETVDIISEKSLTDQNQKSESLDKFPNEKQIYFMYIQMEFCEKSTLRSAIDNNLYKDENKVSRLFREIIEGLAHIHQQKMIHRDLKPVNIFLDSQDHVKIGDFGLATMNIKSKVNEYKFMCKSPFENQSEESLDEGKTGLIGTTLYVAPELNVGTRAFYNQTVDIYSLGIIYFEMCYSPFKTAMERIYVLNDLRSKEIVFPNDFNKKSKEYLIRWLLNHDPSKRPTSEKLLESEYVPPPVFEECELRRLVRHALNNPQLNRYKFIIASCFNQSFTPAQDLTYDKEFPTSNSTKPLQLYDFVKQIIIKIFKQHGGQSFSTPLLMPKNQYYDNESCVKLMTHFGGIVSLPHDLRVSFARYIAWNGITSFRRYSIEKVYREKKVFGFMPRELYECAFDIVTPIPGSFISDAEILYMVFEIIKELPVVKNKQFTIRLNHSSLLKAILLHFGIKDNHEEIYPLISGVKERRIPKTQIQAHLIGFGLSDNSINTFLNLLDSQFDISKVGTQMQFITKKKSEAGHLAKQAIQELKIISENAQAFGVTFDILISPGIAYKVHQYSGMICQLVCEVKKKHRYNNMEVIAAGGRYDSTINYYRNLMDQANILNKDSHQSAVGISIAFDKLVHIIQKESEELPKIDFMDAAVCSFGVTPMLREKTKILRNLWAAGIKCSLMEGTTINEIQDQCKTSGVPFIIILKDSDQGTVRVRYWEKDNRFQDKLFSESELVENMLRMIKNRNEGLLDKTQSAISRSDSKIYSTNERNELKISIDIVFLDKISSNSRKRYEIQINSQLENLYKRLTGCVIVLCINIELNIIRTIASYLEFETEHFDRSVETVIEKHQRHKKYLTKVCDEIYEHKMKRTNPFIILYSLVDSSYQLLI